MTTLALFSTLGMPELIILAILGLLIFGRRLPEVGRGLGKSIVEFRKGLKGVEDEIEDAVSRPSLPKRDEAGRGQIADEAGGLGGTRPATGIPGTIPQEPTTPGGSGPA